MLAWVFVLKLASLIDRLWLWGWSYLAIVFMLVRGISGLASQALNPRQIDQGLRLKFRVYGLRFIGLCCAGKALPTH